MSIQVSNWHGLYREGWGSRLRPASFAHPAKNSYGPSVRIYEHAIEEGWVKPGDYVVDCFSGIGGFALEAMRHGLNFVGCELEQRFVDMAQGCNCTGISKADWVRFQGRWDRARYQDGRHWCPECLRRASEITNEREFKPLPLPGTKWAALAKVRRPTLFTWAIQATYKASYVRNSNETPWTTAHRYHGNIETWEAQGMAGTARIVQGDSRRLGEVLAEARLCLSSPPYAGTISSQKHGLDLAKSPCHADRTKHVNRSLNGLGGSYGQTKGNLGNLPDTGFEAALAVSSPVYIGNTASDDPDKRGGLYRDPKRRNDKALTATYSEDKAQLAQMPEGDLALAISNPPWQGNLAQDGRGADNLKIVKQLEKKYNRRYTERSFSSGNYSDGPGQLAALPEGDHAEACERPVCCVSSPPWEASTISEDIQFVSNRPNTSHQAISATTGYGDTAGQLGQQQGSTFWAASRQILEEVYKVLAPGGHAIWVVKMFVRNKKLVDFPGQWEALCQSVGFRTVCKHRAWMNKNADIVQITLDGEEMSMEKWYKSFFRILCESKGSPRIDWELVLCMVKE